MSMKRVLGILLACLLLFSSAMAAEKYTELPAHFAVEVLSEGQPLLDGKAYSYKEYLKTNSEMIDSDLKAIVDDFEKKWMPDLQADPKKRGNRNSRLDVDIVYYRTGENYLSTMVLARTVYYREQLALEISTQTYDLLSGERIVLADLFIDDDAAWDYLAAGVREQLENIYPGEERNEAAIGDFVTRDSLEGAYFTLSGMELTLHYPAEDFFEGKKNLLHVRFYYPELDGLLSPLGKKVTDNSRWKMVAITCDDGPKDYNSTDALTAFRKVGARVTYFWVGRQLERYGDVAQRQADQNHSYGNHTYNHWSGYSMSKPSRRLKELTDNDVLTLALVGGTAPYFRAPGGTYPPWAEAKLSIPIIQWSLDTYDFTGKSPEKIMYAIRDSIKEYDIVLCHDTGNHLFKAVPLFGEFLTNNGYMMVTLQELLAAQEKELTPNLIYWSFRDGENSVDRSNLKKK